MDRYPPTITQKKRGFFSTVAWGISATVVTLIISTSSIILYGMNIADRKTGSLYELIEFGVDSLPQLAEALPPFLSDAINDERRPEYAEELNITARLAKSEYGRLRPVVVVENDGDEVVSLMSMRIVLLDEDGNPLSEVNEWVATPIAGDDDEWRGPLLPGETRRFRARMQYGCRRDKQDAAVDVAYEITEIRTWRGPSSGSTGETGGSAASGDSPALTTM